MGSFRPHLRGLIAVSLQCLGMPRFLVFALFTLADNSEGIETPE